MHDLKKKLSDQNTFKIFKGEGWHEADSDERSWYDELHSHKNSKGLFNHVYIFNNECLIAYCYGRTNFDRLLKLPYTKVHQDCMPAEGTVKFPWTQKYLDEVGTILRLRRKRKLDKKHRKVLTERIKEHQFSAVE